DFADINTTDTSLSNAVERIFCLTAQNAGYYSAYIETSEQARSDLSNFRYMLFSNHGILRIAQENGLGTSNWELVAGLLGNRATSFGAIHPNQYLETVSTRMLFKKLVKRFFPKKIWRKLSEKRARRLYGG
ncbi:MAG: hypothetical protein LBM93_05835, partial [Oscillospiraceae bacterium]|nr:hypothetical protein [Oscillospiraceae bacterium]